MIRLPIEINLPDIVGKGYGGWWNSKKRYRVCKGGRASKKSRTAGLWFIYNIMKHKGSNAVVVRRIYNTHKDSTFAVLKWAAERLKVSHLWYFKESPLECIYRPTGQKILFRGFDDPVKLNSITVAVGDLCWSWIEEAFEIEDEEDFRTFDESIRGELPDGLWKQHTLTYNPWVNQHWTKTRFFDNVDPEAFTLTTTYKCNEWLDDSDRKLIEDLEHSNPDRYKVVGLGEYGIPGGAYFDEFRRDIHVIEPFVIPDHWNRYTTKDYGLDMLANYWVAVDTYGNAFVYKELYESNLIISDAAKRIKEVNGKDIIKIKYAPPDLENRRQETGKSAFDIFRENGEICTKSDNKRIDGWYSVKEWLKPFETKDEQTGAAIKTARLKIFSNCVNLIRTLPQLQRDEKDANDCATEPHEITHAPDALRGFCIMRQRATIETLEKYKHGGLYARAELKNKGFSDIQITQMAREGKIKLIGK
jgi:phage terminase large subunit